MKFKNVAIMGAGAIGSYLIWGLSDKAARPDGINMCIVASGSRKTRYEHEGFIINDKCYHPEIRTPEEARGADLLVVALKYNSLLSSLEDIRAVADDHTVILSLMNGVDSEEIIGNAVGGTDNIVYSLIKIASERIGNNVRFNAGTTIGMIYGEADLSRGTERIDALDELFSGTGLHYRSSDIIIPEIWSKFRLNIQNNQPQAIIGCGVGAYRDSEHVAFIKQKLREEVSAIAAAKGVDIDSVPVTSDTGSPVADRARFSTLQDLYAHRHTEVDMFAGTVIRLGRELGIPTPFNEFAFHAIKALEEKNDGLFDYE